MKHLTTDGTKVFGKVLQKLTRLVPTHSTSQMEAIHTNQRREGGLQPWGRPEEVPRPKPFKPVPRPTSVNLFVEGWNNQPEKENYMYTKHSSPKEETAEFFKKTTATGPISYSGENPTVARLKREAHDYHIKSKIAQDFVAYSTESEVTLEDMLVVLNEIVEEEKMGTTNWLIDSFLSGDSGTPPSMIHRPSEDMTREGPEGEGPMLQTLWSYELENMVSDFDIFVIPSKVLNPETRILYAGRECGETFEDAINRKFGFAEVERNKNRGYTYYSSHEDAIAEVNKKVSVSNIRLWSIHNRPPYEEWLREKGKQNMTEYANDVRTLIPEYLEGDGRAPDWVLESPAYKNKEAGTHDV